MRLDRLLVEKRSFSSREKAAYAIRAGGVQINGRTITKPAATVDANARIHVNTQAAPRIGRGEHKLAGVLEKFGIDCAGKIALDVGSGAGGFTWQLLQQGAEQVYAVDVGTNQLHDALRADARVAVHEQTDVRDLTSLPEPPHIATVDVSFISVRLVLPHVKTLTRAGADFVVLLKPQFETATVEREKGRSIREIEAQRRVYDAFVAWCSVNGFTVKGNTESPLRGKRGNREVFVHLKSASLPVPASKPFSAEK